jgi:hypothetical protein
MLEQFRTCTPVMAFFRPWQSARSVNASRVGYADEKNCRSPTQSRSSIVATTLLKLGDSSYFFADEARYRSQFVRRAK